MSIYFFHFFFLLSFIECICTTVVLYIDWGKCSDLQWWLIGFSFGRNFISNIRLSKLYRNREELKNSIPESCIFLSLSFSGFILLFVSNSFDLVILSTYITLLAVSVSLYSLIFLLCVGGTPTERQDVVVLAKIVICKSEGENCVICLDEMELGSKFASTRCGHYFHQKCITKWLKESVTCPICRKNLMQDLND